MTHVLRSRRANVDSEQKIDRPSWHTLGCNGIQLHATSGQTNVTQGRIGAAPKTVQCAFQGLTVYSEPCKQERPFQ